MAATSDYFPLQQGNSWVYRGTAKWFDRQPQTIEVQGTEKFRDREYTKVQFFGRTIYLRSEGETLYNFNTAAGQESRFLKFDAAEKQTFEADIDDCTIGARVESKSATVKTPAGEWSDALQFTFQSKCADAGVTTMYFVRGLGPVVYETTSIAGPVRFELSYSRANDAVAESPQLSFTVALDSPRYKVADPLNIQVRLTLRNTTTEPVVLNFPSGQRYDLRIWNDHGDGVYSWSANKLFVALFTVDRVAPGERTFAFTTDGLRIPPGRYLAEAWLATQSREFVGTIGFEVVE